MADIEVTPSGSTSYTVVVSDGGSETRHEVDVEPDTFGDLGVDPALGAHLVERSFEFLLERESKEAILPRFELSVIGRYFPEYPDEIRRRLNPGTD